MPKAASKNIIVEKKIQDELRCSWDTECDMEIYINSEPSKDVTILEATVDTTDVNHAKSREINLGIHTELDIKCEQSEMLDENVEDKKSECYLKTEHKVYTESKDVKNTIDTNHAKFWEINLGIHTELDIKCEHTEMPNEDLEEEESECDLNLEHKIYTESKDVGNTTDANHAKSRDVNLGIHTELDVKCEHTVMPNEDLDEEESECDLNSVHKIYTESEHVNNTTDAITKDTNHAKSHEIKLSIHKELDIKCEHAVSDENTDVNEYSEGIVLNSRNSGLKENNFNIPVKNDDFRVEMFCDSLAKGHKDKENKKGKNSALKRSKTALNAKQTSLTCEICKKQFKKSCGLTSHLQTHNEVRHECKICNKQYKLKRDFSYHLLKHSGERPFKCKICKKQFKTKYHVLSHSVTHSEERPFMCKICKKQFKTKHHLLSHSLTHSENKPYQCDICNNKFARKSYLSDHLKRHSRGNPSLSYYECDICNKQFACKFYLAEHLNIHSGKNSYKCEICKKEFAHRSTLSSHIFRIHKKTSNEYKNQFTQKSEKLHECSVCKRRFLLKDSLRTHLRIHEEGPYECDICKKIFVHKTSLARHCILHTGIKPYECEICKKKFGRQTVWSDHVRNHSKERPYECEICKKRFNIKSYLKKHIINKHSGD